MKLVIRGEIFAGNRRQIVEIGRRVVGNTRGKGKGKNGI